jgi:hypothetical protein
MRGLWGLSEEPAGWVLVLKCSEVLKKKLITMWDLRWGQTFGDRIQWKPGYTAQELSETK